MRGLHDVKHHAGALDACGDELLREAVGARLRGGGAHDRRAQPAEFLRDSLPDTARGTGHQGDFSL
ncbi:hypothetical protein D3C83_59390 [compost metagenome]